VDEDGMESGVSGMSTDVGDVFPLKVGAFDVVLKISDSLMVDIDSNGLRTTDPGVMFGSSSTFFI